ncbi:DUF2975 domain-containing protein [Nocardiopsis sp. CC223A]|uniref:DUF2975 domain-containing protein n=1 Tax=Nocardiopsis sp. CC223A TaxID=3044051 RepID=UPI0027956880|nr:DUF2975 domain-containing protein [Nocardiopsis sp. CC223A]
MHSYITLVLRVGVALAILVGLFGQVVVIPGAAADEVERFPPYAPYELPYVILAILGVACVQVALVAVWALLAMVERDAIFTRRTFFWVDVIIGATLAASLLTAGVTVHLLVDSDIPSPADGMELIGALGAAFTTTAGGVAFALLLVLMRGLLRKATELQSEMSEVV